MTTRIHRGWVLGIAAGAALLTASLPAMADRDDHDHDNRGRDRWDHRDRGWDHDRDDHDRHDGRIDFRIGTYRPAVVERRVVEVTPCPPQVEQVCVEPGHYESRYVPAVVERQYRKHKIVDVVICPAHYEQVWVPARYETRTVVPACPPVQETHVIKRDKGWHFDIGGGFRF